MKCKAGTSSLDGNDVPSTPSPSVSGICSDTNSLDTLSNVHYTALAYDARKVADNWCFTPQSGVEQTEVGRSVYKMASQQKQQNVTYDDQMSSYVYDNSGGLDPTRQLQDTDDTSLDNFFKRPIKIREIEWGTGTALADFFDPWSLYFDNKRVINRINNYNLLRAKLHLKIVINGNGFQYGRAIAAYSPVDDFDELSTHSTLIPQDMVQTSQLPHVYLDPTTSTGGEMVLPFYWYKNYLNIPNSDWSLMGKLYVQSINDLKHANGAADQVTVSIFAWAEDVQLAVPTSVNSDALVPQSGMESDEIDKANKDGMISGPATTASKVAGALATIPQIKPFALATQAALKGIASGAKMMGYCRPPVTKNPEPYRPMPTSHLAATNVPDTAQKLTVDDKNEMTIDPTIAGLQPEDPLNIRNIASRESYLTKFTWSIGTSPETLLWNARVDPVTWAETTTGNAYLFPACAMAALPFKYWTGTMKFRFQIVCSAFHKGRLKFVYDPNYLDSNEYNTNYLQIIDIADKTDFTIEVGNGQDITLLSHHLPGPDSATQMYSTSAYTAKEEGNGVLGVYVVNELTTPNSTVNNDIEINVFVSMGEDFEVFVPDDHFQKFVCRPQLGFEPQSGMEGGNLIVPESQGTTEPSAPIQKESSLMAMPVQNTDLINKVFIGEAITSFRPLLKRYNLWRRFYFTSSASVVRWLLRMAYFPFLRGAVTGAVDTADSAGVPFAYNYCNTVLLHWVVLAHQGFRGSIRWKALPDKNNSAFVDSIASRIYVQRELGGAAPYSFTTSAVSTYGKNEDAATEILPNLTLTQAPRGPKGTAFATDAVNPNLEFEVPYYKQDRFLPGKIMNYTVGVNNTYPTMEMDIKAYASNYQSMDMHCAAGEDFQVYFFTGLPRMYYEPSPPTP